MEAMLRVVVTAAVIISVCLMVHVAGILLMAEWLLGKREYFEQRATKRHFAGLIVTLFTGVMFLHLVQTGLWAAFYYVQNLFDDFETSLYFSMVSFATIGYGDVLLPRRWRLLGVVEGFSGVILCGISTAFIFAVVNAVLQLRIQQRSK
ncbi:MAG TPA: potassium channel family protein [Pyrinomonadaceae bacterium]|nr:potassium channel family protein [Pyrinomonadaceae bacterium]